MANKEHLERIDTALDAASDPSLDSKPTCPTAGTADTNWLLHPPGDPSAPEQNSVCSTAAPVKTGPRLEQLGRYRLEKVLGRGGMGEVWLAHDPQLNRRVAIKTVRPDVRWGAEALAMFLEEGRRLASLNHASIIPVYDCGNEQGICYLVSEYVAQGTLADYLKRESVTYQQAAELVARIAEAAHYAHLRGLVHRDIKPANILMREDGKPLLADFGLAIAEEEQLREAPGTLGTYAYMAPEQMLGESRFVDGRADIYSLGVVLYQLLTGRMPYLANTREEYRELSLHRDPRPPRSVKEDIPAELEAICLKCLARQPSERYSTAADLAAALHRITAKPLPLQQRPKLPAWQLLVSFVALLGLVCIGIAWMQLAQPQTSANGGAPPQGDSPSVSPVSSEARRWQDRLGQAPRELLWPGYRGQAGFGFRDDLNVFEISSPYPRFAALGKIESGTQVLSIEFNQPTRTVGYGLFFAYQEEPIDGVNCATFHAVTLEDINDTNGRQFRLRRAKYKLDARDGRFYTVLPFGAEEVPWPALATFTRLELQLSDGELIQARWGAMSLESIANKAPRATDSLGPLTGTWGVLHQSGTTWCRDVAVKSQP